MNEKLGSNVTDGLALSELSGESNLGFDLIWALSILGVDRDANVMTFSAPGEDEN